MKYLFCPLCGSKLYKRHEEHWWQFTDEPLKLVHGLVACEMSSCSFVFYDNPVPVAVVLASYEDDPEHKIVLVKRKYNPFAGHWALPGGHIDKYEIPKVAAVREMFEETGLKVRLEKILCVYAPAPGAVNILVVSYLARIIGGELKAGDDAEDARFFKQEDCPEIPFSSHKMIVAKWWQGRHGWLTGVDLD